MVKEVLQITPQLTTSDLNKMEQSLNSRFGKVAKKFGKGLLDVVMGGGILGVGLALIQRLLNPLKEVQEAVDRTLNKSSDLTTQATHFGSNAGELAKLHAFGSAKGIESGSLDVLVEKFQQAVVAAQKDPTTNSPVRQFVGKTDMVSSFLTFVDNLKKASTQQQEQVQEEVFGGKQILKMSEFLHSDFEALANSFKDISIADITKSAEKISKLADLDKLNKAHRELQDFNDKGKVMNGGIIAARDTADAERLKAENKRIASYDSLASIDIRIEKILNKVEEVSTEILKDAPIILDALGAVPSVIQKGHDITKDAINWIKSSPIKAFGKGGYR